MKSAQRAEAYNKVVVSLAINDTRNQLRMFLRTGEGDTGKSEINETYSI